MLTLALVGGGLLLLAVLLAWGTRVVLRRKLGLGRRPRGIQRYDAEVDRLLGVMGLRMDRPWMPQELQAMTGLSAETLGAYLARARARKLVSREWQDHPVTGEEFEAARLTSRGVRAFGAYAPDDHLAYGEGPQGEEIEDAPVLRLSDFIPLDEDSADAPDAEDDQPLPSSPPAPAASLRLPAPEPRGFRQRRRS